MNGNNELTNQLHVIACHESVEVVVTYQALTVESSGDNENIDYYSVYLDLSYIQL